MKKITCLLTMYLLFFQIVIAQKNKPILLAYQYQTGNKYEFSIEADQKIHVMGIDMPQSLIFTILYEVLSVDTQGNGLMKMTYKRIRFKQDNPAGKVDVDTDIEATQEGLGASMAEAFGRLKGMSITMRIAKNGEIIEVVEAEEAIKQVFTKQQNTFSVFPTKPIKVGKSWQSEEKLDMSGVKMTMKFKNTLKSIEDGKVTILSEGISKDAEGKVLGTTSMTSTYQQTDFLIFSSKGNQDFKNMKVNNISMDILSKSIITSFKK